MIIREGQYKVRYGAVSRDNRTAQSNPTNSQLGTTNHPTDRPVPSLPRVRVAEARSKVQDARRKTYSVRSKTSVGGEVEVLVMAVVDVDVAVVGRDVWGSGEVEAGSQQKHMQGKVCCGWSTSREEKTTGAVSNNEKPRTYSTSVVYGVRSAAC